MKKTFAVITILAGAVVGAQAGVVFSEPFNYPDGQITTNTTKWVNNSGATPMCVSNQQLIVTTARAEDIAHAFTSPFYWPDVGRLYSSFQVKFWQEPTAVGTYFTHFTGTNMSSTYRARVWSAAYNFVGQTNAPTGYFFLGIGNNLPGGSPVVYPTNSQIATPFTTNVWYTVVTRYQLTNNTATIWVGTDASAMAETDDHATASDFLDLTNRTSIFYYGFRQATGEGSMWIDDLKVGTQFADVAGPNQAPVVSSVPNQSMTTNQPSGALGFTIGDAETAASDLTVTASSGDQTLVNDSSIVLATVPDTGGTNRTIAFTTTGQQGKVTITISVDDGVNTSTSTFVVTIGQPTISAIPNQTVLVNTAIPAIAFTVSDAESDTLNCTAYSSNTNLITTSGISFGGSGNNRNVTLTPVSGKTGVANITVYVDDGHTTNSSRFSLTVYQLLGVVYDEDFKYTSFDTPNALYLATGGSGGPWTHVSGTAYQLQVTNFGDYGLAYIVGGTNASEDLGAAFIGGTQYFGSNGYVFYTSFTVNFSYLPSPSGEYFFHLSDSAGDTSNFRDKVFSQRLNAPTGMLRLGIANMATSPVQLPRDLATNQTYAVVTRYNASTGESTIWVNPISEQSPSATSTDSPGTATIGGVALREATYQGDLAIGPIKVGTSFGDVFTPPEKTALHYSLDGSGNIVLTWAGSPLLALGVADNVNGPYTVIPGAASGISIPIATTGNKFFALLY